MGKYKYLNILDEYYDEPIRENRRKKKKKSSIKHKHEYEKVILKNSLENALSNYYLGEICVICGKVNITNYIIILKNSEKRFFKNIYKVEDIMREYPEYKKVIEYSSEGLR